MNNNQLAGNAQNASNFPGINDEYSIMAARRRPSADIGNPNALSAGGLADQYTYYSKPIPGQGSSRGTAQNDAGTWQRSAKQSPLTPVQVTNRKKGQLQGGNENSMGDMTPSYNPTYHSQQNSQMTTKHRSIDEVKMMVNNQIRNPQAATTTRHKMQTDNGAMGQTKPGIAKNQQMMDQTLIHNYRGTYEQKLLSPHEAEQIMSNGQNAMQQLSGHGDHSMATAMTHLSSPTTRRLQGVNNNESSFLPKIDKNQHNIMMAQSQVQTMKPSRQNSSQDQNARGHSNIRQKEYHTGRPMGSFENKINTDYLGGTCDFTQNSRHKREKLIDTSKMNATNTKTTTKMMGGQLPGPAHLFNQMNNPQQFNSYNQHQQMQGKPNKHHIKAHSQNFESGHPHMAPSSGQKEIRNHHRRDKNDSAMREKQDKQLEDLNETLQRLAREKYNKNVPAGAGGMQARKKQRNATNFTDKTQYANDIQHMVAGIDPMLNHLGFDKYNQQNAMQVANTVQGKAPTDSPNKKKDKKSKKKQHGNMDLMQQKFESQQRNQMMLGDPLVNQRLQAVKQTSQTKYTQNVNVNVNKNAVQGQQAQQQPKQGTKSPASHGRKADAQMSFTPHNMPSSNPQGYSTQQVPPHTQKVFKINMTLIDKSQGANPSNSSSEPMQPGVNPENNNMKDGVAQEAVLSSNSAQQMYTKNGIKISGEEPLVLRNNHIKMSSAQSPISFRQSQEHPTALMNSKMIRNSNLIGPEKILQQSLHIDSNNSSKMTSYHNYQGINRQNTQSEQNHQLQNITNMSDAEGQASTPWTQKGTATANSKHQSIWNNTTLNQRTSGHNDQSPYSSATNIRNNKHNSEQQQQNLKLHIGQQFSSVMEDVEMEQQTSPLRGKNRQELLAVNTANSQNSLLSNYGAAGFQMAKTSVNKIKAQGKNGSDLETINSSQLQDKSSKEQLISEIKYHYSREKEMKAMAAAAAVAKGQTISVQPFDLQHNANSAPPQIVRTSPSEQGSGAKNHMGEFVLQKKGGTTEFWNANGGQAREGDEENNDETWQAQVLATTGQLMKPDMRSPQFAGSRNQQNSLHFQDGGGSDTGKYASGHIVAQPIASPQARDQGPNNHKLQWEAKSKGDQAFQVIHQHGAMRMNETMNIKKGKFASGNNALDSTFGKVGLATQQAFVGDSVRRSQSNSKKTIHMVDGNTRDNPEKLPMLTRVSPAANYLQNSALRGSNEVNLLRASLRDSQSHERQSIQNGEQSSKSKRRHRETIDQDHYLEHQSDVPKRSKRKTVGIDEQQNIEYGTINRDEEHNDHVQIHMSQVFSSVISQEPDQEDATPQSLNENVQIIHQGVEPSNEKYLTYTYSGSPRYDRRAPGVIIQEPQVQGRNESDLALSQSKQSLRNNSSINRHKKQIVDERKVVQRTQTQRLAEPASTQQYNEQVIQSQLNDLTGQVSVSKMQTETALYLELPPQGSGRGSAIKKSKTKTGRESHGRSPSRQRDQGQPLPQKGQKSPSVAQGKNLSQGPVRQHGEVDGGRGNNQGPRNSSSSNQPQHRKTQSNISPTKKERQSILKDVKQGQKPQQPLPSSRPYTPPVVDDGDLSSDAPESVHQLRVGFRISRENYSFCHEYIQFKGQNKLPKECRYLFTGRSYQKGESQFAWSTRLYLSRECAFSEDRRRYPILIVNLDGAVGAWDDFNKNHYVLRPKVVEGLIQLSYDFRLVAVSSNRQRLICRVVQALMNVSPGASSTGGQSVDAANNSSLQHLVFDAVYQLNSQNADVKYTNSIKNIDEIHFDLTQALTDMQFQKHKKKKQFSNRDHERVESATDKFKTFWETEEYRPCKKVLILTTDRSMFKSHCYSFDYNFLFQARKFMHEESKKAPIVLQLPHMRQNPKISFDIVVQTIFTLQNIAQALSCQKQDSQKCVEGEIYSNPDLSGFEICKKLLSSKFRNQHHKMKKEGNAKGLRVFDQQKDLFVDLELIDFGQAYSFLKKYLQERRSDWLTVKKYYLLYKPERVEITPLKLKQNLKVTFEESPDIRRIGDDQREKAGSSLNGRAGATTHDSSKSDKFSFVKNQYVSEEAKNLYNALMIRNYKIQQEINSFARHHRIQQQRKLEKKKEQDRLAALQEEHQTPIVIYDSDKDDERRAAEPKLRSSLKEYPTHKMNLEKEKLEQERKQEMKDQKQQKEKKYAFKYRVLKIRTNEPIDEGDISLKHYQVINLRIQPVTQYALRVPGGQGNDGGMGVKDNAQAVCATPRYVHNQDYLQHTANAVLDGTEGRNFLIDLLSKRQTKISYSTNQEMHLKNNLNQLVDGEQQYKDQQHKLTQDEKEQMAASQNPGENHNHKQNNNDKTDNYIDKI